jgi:hypothetical protein
VLCYLEGKTNAEAALHLGLPIGTIASRLAWARDRLRRRLTRRGIALSAGAFGALQAEASAGVVPAAALVGVTLRAAFAFASGRIAVGSISPHVISWTEGVLRAMFVTKIKIAVGLVLAIGLFGGGLAWKQSGGPGEGAARAEQQSGSRESPSQEQPVKPLKSKATTEEEERTTGKTSPRQENPAKPPKTKAQLEAEERAANKARQLADARDALQNAQAEYEEYDAKWSERIGKLGDETRQLLDAERGKLVDIDLRIKKLNKDQALADSRVANLSHELDREVIDEGRREILEKRLKTLKEESDRISNRLAQDEREREDLRRTIDSRRAEYERKAATLQRRRDLEVNRARTKVEAAAARLRHLEGFDFPQESPALKESVRDLYQRIETLERAVADLRKQIKQIEDRDSK